MLIYSSRYLDLNQEPSPYEGAAPPVVLYRNNLFVPTLRAARSFSDFQSGPITGFGLEGQVFKVLPAPVDYHHFLFSLHLQDSDLGPSD